MHPDGAPLLSIIKDVRDADWIDNALCAQTDPEAFFPERGKVPAEAKRICQSCPVRADCLDYALRTGQRFGVWGGLSERERRRLQPSRQHAA